MMIVSLPTLVLGLVIATLLAAVFHLWLGGGLGRFILYIFLGWLGFWFGHLLANYMNWAWDSLGPLHLGTAAVFCVIFMLAGYWLSLVQPDHS
jgi:hypothetical protein